MKTAILNWSGGKDSCLALCKIMEEKDYKIHTLLTSFSKIYERVSMHGVRKSLMECQASQIGIPLHSLMLPAQITMIEYDKYMLEIMQYFKEQGINDALFGDIFLEDLRRNRQNQLQKVKMKAGFPLWGASTKKLARQFIDAGFKAIITSADSSKLDASFVGRTYDRRFLEDLPGNVDACGEFGAFHTFVYDGPIFKAPVSFKKGKMVERTYFTDRENSMGNKDYSYLQNSDYKKNASCWFVDLLPV